MKHKRRSPGFTIVEMLIVIVVIAILASITVVAYNGIQQRAQDARRDADLSILYRAMMVARINTGMTLMQITGGGWTLGHCTSATYNPTGAEPRTLPKTDDCWVTYYTGLDRISLASGANLSGLKAGDPRGNPYSWDENQGDLGNCSAQDRIYYFSGNGTDVTLYKPLPTYESC